MPSSIISSQQAILKIVRATYDLGKKGLTGVFLSQVWFHWGTGEKSKLVKKNVKYRVCTTPNQKIFKLVLTTGLTILQWISIARPNKQNETLQLKRAAGTWITFNHLEKRWPFLQNWVLQKLLEEVFHIWGTTNTTFPWECKSQEGSISKVLTSKAEVHLIPLHLSP